MTHGYDFHQIGAEWHTKRKNNSLIDYYINHKLIELQYNSYK